ncbi:MAG: iron ABC transporter permease [Xanthobacteraceae bacterium]|nr:iron ABC transporter permease [Xanthobacteraceae bacterium]
MSAGDAALSISWRRAGRTRPILIGCAALLVIAFVASLAIGPVVIAPGKVISILFDAMFHGRPTAGIDMRDAVVVLDIRLPRAVLAAIVGAALAVAGALLQGIFRNPLADPGLVGVSPGAALAAVAWIVFGGALASHLPYFLFSHALSFAAFAGSLIAILLLYRLATYEGRTSVANLLFAGIALGALASAGTGLIIFIASDLQLREFTFWTLGSLGAATWPRVLLALPFTVLLIGGSLWLARGLDMLALGEAEAFHSGVNVERMKRIAIVIVAAGVGAAVAVSGIIGFVGLVVPHLLRLTAGPSHKSLIIGSAFLGAALLTASDIFARTAASPAELPIGIVTAFIGAPFFIWLLRQNRRSFG